MKVRKKRGVLTTAPRRLALLLTFHSLITSSLLVFFYHNESDLHPVLIIRETILCLNLVIYIHSRGVKSEKKILKK